MQAQTTVTDWRRLAIQAARSALVNFGLLTCGALATFAADPDEFALLSPKVSVGDLQRVKVLVEMKGDLELSAEADASSGLPVTLKATLIYDEKITRSEPASGYGAASVRHYNQAKASIQYASGQLQPELRDDRRIIAVSPASTATRATPDRRPTIFSPLGPLTRDELDLLEVPASSLLIDALLPDRAVKVGQSWQLNSPQLAALLGLETVHHHQLKCKLDQLDKDSALVHIAGQVSGAVEGVTSEIRLAAKYSFHRKRQRIDWFAMSLQEKRSAGHAQSGSNITARIQVATLPLSGVPTLDDRVLDDLSLTPEDAQQLLELTSKRNGFQLLSERKWHLITERPDVVVLRLVDRGDLVAQCNVSTLPPLAAGKEFGMVEFQQDVKRALEDNLAKFITASESRTDEGVEVLRVVAAGEASEVPIQWVYYHLRDKQGRRASCVFTLEADLAERFGAADQALISSFRFVDPESPASSDTVDTDNTATADRGPHAAADERR